MHYYKKETLLFFVWPVTWCIRICMYIILSTRSAAVCFWTIAFIRTSKVRVPMLSFYVHGSVSLFVYDIAWHSSTTCSTSRSIYLHDCCRRECITEMISIPLFVSPVTSCKDMYVHLWCMWTLISHEYIPFRNPIFYASRRSQCFIRIYMVQATWTNTSGTAWRT